MKITEIRTLVLGVKIDEPISTSFGTMTHRYMILVNIRTSSGLQGWGESWSNFPAWSPYERIHTINTGLAPLLIGEDPREVDALHKKSQLIRWNTYHCYLSYCSHICRRNSVAFIWK